MKTLIKILLPLTFILSLQSCKYTKEELAEGIYVNYDDRTDTLIIAPKNHYIRVYYYNGKRNEVSGKYLFIGDKGAYGISDSGGIEIHEPWFVQETGMNYDYANFCFDRSLFGYTDFLEGGGAISYKSNISGDSLRVTIWYTKIKSF